MATATRKVLGQSYPSAATVTTLYTVPAATETVVSSLVICNQSGVSDAVRVAIRQDDEALATKHYIYYGLVIPANDTFVMTAGLTIDAGDVVSVYATNGTCSFSLYGQEIT
jgi:hypothetical protein